MYDCIVARQATGPFLSLSETGQLGGKGGSAGAYRARSEECESRGIEMSDSTFDRATVVDVGTDGATSNENMLGDHDQTNHVCDLLIPAITSCRSSNDALSTNTPKSTALRNSYTSLRL